MYTLYVIRGSHACRSAILMLEHKGVPFRQRNVVTLLHPVAVRLRGFDAGGQERTIDGRRTLSMRIGDLLGTVPALRADGQRLSTNHQIARYLDERHPDPPLFPADPERRRAVEEAERWANENLQMAARRIILPAVRRNPGWFARVGGGGRMGPLLYQYALTRRLVVPLIARFIFGAGRRTERDALAELPGMLDRIDAWIAAGVLGGPQPNAADFMVVPSLALMLYRPDVRPVFEGRAALDLVDRLLPEPG